MHRDAHTQAHKDTHTHQHLEGSLVIKNTPTHSTHSAHSLRTPKQIYIHTHGRITQARKDTPGQVPDSDKEHPSTHGHTTHRQAQLQRNQLQETGSMRARQGPERGQHPTLSKSVVGGSVEDLGNWSSSDGARLLPFHPGSPHHLPSPGWVPAGVGSGLGRGRGQTGPGRGHQGKGAQRSRRAGKARRRGGGDSSHAQPGHRWRESPRL